ncbi:MAG: hypothetical protein R2748_26035 [Bryobacterales bacterium]
MKYGTLISIGLIVLASFGTFSLRAQPLVQTGFAVSFQDTQDTFLTPAPIVGSTATLTRYQDWKNGRNMQQEGAVAPLPGQVVFAGAGGWYDPHTEVHLIIKTHGEVRPEMVGKADQYDLWRLHLILPGPR